MKKHSQNGRPLVSAVIAAAGVSHRMCGCDKKLILLLGVPVLVRTVSVFDNSPCIDEIVVVTSANDLAYIQQLLDSYGLSKVKAVVPGGLTRQASVFAGIAACSPASDYYAIHDGARPLVSPQLISEAVAAAQKYGAAAPGVPVKETIKIMNSDGFVKTTPRRDTLCVIQTPQVFSCDIYQRAVQAAQGQDFTDDCQLAENAGFPVFVTQGEHTNIKITTLQDIPLCEAILKQQLDAGGQYENRTWL